jgi:hypothetical protein
MNEEVNDNELIDSKKKQASEQVLSFYEVYTYHVLKIVCGIIFIGVPLIYSLKIGRSGILSGVLNYKSSGYCSPFNKPFISNAGKPYDGYDNDNGPSVNAVLKEGDDNTIITDDISFYVSLQQCINDTFKTSEETPDGNDSVCKISYGKLIKFGYDNAIKMLSSTNLYLNDWIQLQNWIQYTAMEPIPSLSDQVITQWKWAKYETPATFLTYVLSILYLLFINFPLDIFRRIFVLAIVLYDIVFGCIINFFTYWIGIPYSFFEIVLLFLPSLLMLGLPMSAFFNLFYYIFKSVSYIFIAFFIVYYFVTVGMYIYYIAKSYSKAADSVDVFFLSMKLLIYIGAIIIILMLIIQIPFLLPAMCIIVQLVSILIMFFISILPLTFEADIIDNDSSSTKKKYSYVTCIRGLKYKQSYILLLLLIVFIYDLFSCNVVSLSGGSLGSVFIFLIILLVFSYFNNTLIYQDTKKNGLLASYAINSYKEEALKNSDMIEITKEHYKKYSKSNRITYECNAKFADSTTVLKSYDYSSYSVGGFIMSLIRRFILT